MPKVSSKRQITLPIDLCEETGIKPGDEYVSYINSDTYITIVKQVVGDAKGIFESSDVCEK